MSKRKNKIKVVYRKLGRERVWGWSYSGEGFIEIDSRLKSKRLLRLLIHEGGHQILNLNESQALKLERELANLLWQEGFRRIEQ